MAVTEFSLEDRRHTVETYLKTHLEVVLKSGVNYKNKCNEEVLKYIRLFEKKTQRRTQIEPELVLDAACCCQVQQYNGLRFTLRILGQHACRS